MICARVEAVRSTKSVVVRISQKVWLPVGVSFLSAVLWVLAFPPFGIADAAFVFMVPFTCWASFAPRWKVWNIASLLMGFLSWFAILFWLRHVTWGGLFLISLVMGVYFWSWALVLRWGMPRLLPLSFLRKLCGLLGIAALWVLIEYFRGLLFGGFPWLPLAASQWMRPGLLQLVECTGVWSVSLVLILFNLFLGLGCLNIWTQLKQGRIRRLFSGELLIGIFLIFTLLFAGAQLAKEAEPKTAFRVGIVQPDIPQIMKWDPSLAYNNLQILERETYLVNGLGADLLLWPETATPWPVLGDTGMRERVEELASGLETPLLMGNMAKIKGKWYNSVFLVSAENGLEETYYFKRKLVPFGEYVPFKEYLPFLSKFVPFDEDMCEGTTPGLIPFSFRNEVYQTGSLICYEDIFPRFARSSVEAGADFLFVATNNAWYGQEGGAYQHAAHSVLRAIECRRPVLRCGNAGWSGWIDERGVVREVLENDQGSIYFRGGEAFELTYDKKWSRKLTVYVQYGDWFIVIVLFLAIVGYWALRSEKACLNRG